MSLSDGAKEIVQRHCDGQPGLVEKVTAELEKENVLQVMMLSNLTDAQVETLVTGIATDELKDKKIMVGCALRSCVKDAGFQVDLFAAGQKALPLARNVLSSTAQGSKTDLSATSLSAIVRRSFFIASQVRLGNLAFFFASLALLATWNQQEITRGAPDVS
ncbi:hypothetical protein Pmar_PMAR001383 [Perkinsus marinus ATCC 50983]|uniref:Uncharacterized protein n=1 Tax=Perkinsus marinus (strain ATCC 50983 / TXsc) TaxID=423536 RepID=C5KJJ9_PERM5|nr:hypothetical protein Pmar_PMAR001383 [Perkinsus marinus ATCC 50983]EER15333.1 hypothetical protein Pmar_PMAR001383 [Perkinsus marinus ATCC 50983]|eukprot:XP_002783537.1 hypothetical protein Pmar_PMAR001383 [Perkinsus marinus ATCC 50983]